MKHWNFSRSTVNTEILLAVATEHGVNRDDLLKGSGLEQINIQQSHALIPVQAEMQLIRNLLRLCPNTEGLGLECGARYHLSSFGVWGYALANSPTVRIAAEQSLAHSELIFALSTLSLEEVGDEVLWHFDDIDVPDDIRLFNIEREMAALGSVAHDLLGGKFSAWRIRFQHAEPAHTAHYLQCFNGPIEFSAAHNAFVLPRILLDYKLEVPPEAPATMHEEAVGHSLNNHQDIKETVRNLLIRDRVRVPNMEAIAAELCMTSRTLRRKLESQGCSFRSLADDVRCDLAKELLTRTGLDIGQIAERLSYSDASSFSQAFRRLTGISPSVYRQAEQPA